MRILSGRLCRIGWSTQNATLQLGNDAESFGYGATGVKSHDGDFTPYGPPFETGCVIAALLDADEGRVSFALNGTMLGPAFNLPPLLRGRALFPHVLVKDARVYVNLGQAPACFAYPPHAPLSAHPQTLVSATNRPTNHPREFVMLIGLPSAGKTRWAEQHLLARPEMRYTLLSTNRIMEQMMPRQKWSYDARWEKVFQEANDVFRSLLEKAPHHDRNYILDQTNVFKSARRRKMRGFERWRKVAVCVLPPLAELQRRAAQDRVMTGKNVPEDSRLEMMGNFALPDCTEFDEIHFVDCAPEDAHRILASYHEHARERRKQMPKAPAPSPPLPARPALSGVKHARDPGDEWRGRMDRPPAFPERERERDTKPTPADLGGPPAPHLAAFPPPFPPLKREPGAPLPLPPRDRRSAPPDGAWRRPAHGGAPQLRPCESLHRG